MSAKIRFRGPDGSGLWISRDGNVGLAHRRLAIIDLSEGGAQPMRAEERDVTLSYNGEIYNYRELRRQLKASGHVFKSESDTEVVLNAYLEWGTGAFAKLEGIFALAIWDGQRQEMLLARDHLGVKPLYVTETPRGALFASELKALLCAKDLEREVDAEAVYSHLLYLWSPGPRTLFRAVKKLPPGSFCRVRSGKLGEPEVFYSLPLTRDEVSPAEAEALLEQALIDSVERQLVSDVPVGAFLSGGLDSSALVALAQRKLDVRLPCYTIDYSEEEAKREGTVRDAPFAEKVARHVGASLKTLTVAPFEPDALQEMVEILDEPQADPAPLFVGQISAAAREQGIRVLLSGAGGDDLLTGYRRHYALSLERYWSWLPQPARSFLQETTGALPVNSPLTRKLRKAFFGAGLDGDARIASYFEWIATDRAQELVRADVRGNALTSALRSLPSNVPPLARMLYLETKFFLVDHNLNYTDKMSMRHGVEVRVPLVDLKMVRAAARIPLSLKQRGKEGKWIFKKVMEKYLPSEVIYRPKTGFGAPVRQWLRGPLRPLLDDQLLSPSAVSRDYLDQAALSRLVHENTEGRVDASYTILAALCIELWCRKFLPAAASETY